MNERTYELIDQYANGELNAAEATAVEQRLQSDPEFAEAFQLYQKLFQSLSDRFDREVEETALRETLGEISKQHFQGQSIGQEKLTTDKQRTTEAIKGNLNNGEPQTKITPENNRPKVIRLLFAAAAIAAIILVFIWAPWQQSLLDQYYSTPQLALTARGGDATCETAKIDQQYREKQFAQALPLIETCLAAKPNDAELRFAKAICLLETGKTKSAIEALGSLKDTQTFQEEALWYSALAHLKAGDKEAAKKLLKQIPATADQAPAASELLKKLQ